jgi:hypothetical protein
MGPQTLAPGAAMSPPTLSSCAAATHVTLASLSGCSIRPAFRMRRGEGYALSTFAGHDPAKSREKLVADVARTCCMPQRRLAVTTARRITEAGFRLVPDGELPGHVNIDLGSELTDEVVKRFIDLFEPAVENPTYPAFRKRR